MSTDLMNLIVERVISLIIDEKKSKILTIGVGWSIAGRKYLSYRIIK